MREKAKTVYLTLCFGRTLFLALFLHRGITLLELLYLTGRVDDFLLAGKKRVTTRTEFDAQVFA